MRIPLHSTARKAAFLGGLLFLSLVLMGAAAKEYVALHFAARADLSGLQTAVRLEPGNADYRYKLGRYLLLGNSWGDAAQSFRSAVALNPHRAAYWLELASTYQLQQDLQGQRDALDRAVKADPMAPEVAWEAGNLFLARGETDKALPQMRVVLAGDPSLAPSALQLCWRAAPDVEKLLRVLIPPSTDAHIAFLYLLMGKKETAATFKAWDSLTQLGQTIDTRPVFEYERYLLELHEVDQARLVWQQAGMMAGLSGYQPSPENLVVNGDFGLDVLNGGFDWIYSQTSDVTLGIDPSQFRTGDRSLSLVFDRAKISDAGIRQYVPVQPNTAYDFSAYYKAEDMEGAGGLEFNLQDAYDHTQYFTSEDLKNIDFWKQILGGFTTGPQTRLLILRLQREPAGDVVRGKLWIDGVRINQRSTQDVSR